MKIIYFLTLTYSQYFPANINMLRIESSDPGVTWSIFDQSSKLLDGVIITSLLGFFSLNIEIEHLPASYS